MFPRWSGNCFETLWAPGEVTQVRGHQQLLQGWPLPVPSLRTITPAERQRTDLSRQRCIATPVKIWNGTCHTINTKREASTAVWYCYGKKTNSCQGVNELLHQAGYPQGENWTLRQWSVWESHGRSLCSKVPSLSQHTRVSASREHSQTLEGHCLQGHRLCQRNSVLTAGSLAKPACLAEASREWWTA